MDSSLLEFVHYTNVVIIIIIIIIITDYLFFAPHCGNYVHEPYFRQEYF